MSKKGRIIGGNNVTNDGWIALLYFEEATPAYRCAGTVINDKYILTALHCVVRNTSVSIADFLTFNIAQARVEIRGVNINKKLKTLNKKKQKANTKIREHNQKHKFKGIRKRQPRQTLTLEVDEIILNTEGADLALVKVKGKINTQIFSPICLPGKGDERQSKKGVIAGWGRNDDGTEPGINLKELTVSIPTECTALQNLTNENNWFCFGGESDESACYGDSGGPVMVQENKDQVSTLAGIISGGTQGDCQGYGLAVDVYYWINWVTFNAIDGTYCDKPDSELSSVE